MAAKSRMELTTFLEQKYRKFFKFLDVLKSGYLSKKTFDEISSKMMKCAELNGSDVIGPEVTEKVLKWWSPLETLTDNGQLDESRFIDVIRFIYSDSEEFERLQINLELGFVRLFQAINTSRTDNLTQDELSRCYQWFGVNDKNFCRKVFVALDTDSDGLVREKDCLEALHKYFFSNDDQAGCTVLFG